MDDFQLFLLFLAAVVVGFFLRRLTDHIGRYAEALENYSEWLP